MNIVNGFHFFVPVVPSFRIVPYDLGALFTTKPWDAIGYTPFTVSPFLVGLIFLIPLDITFSCWVFFFYWKAQLVAEVGSPIHDLHFAGLEYLIINLLGTKRLGLDNLSIFPFFWFLTRAHYSDVMPHQLEGFKLAHEAKGYNQRFLLALLSATVFGTVVAFWIILDSSYRHTEPVMSWVGNEPFSRLARRISHPEPPNVQGIFLFFYGFLSGILIMFMRTQFL